MGGGSLAYHLRTAKNIEREIFIILLSKLSHSFNIQSYQYIGFGGPFLEDFRAIHNSLSIKDMISLEVSEEVCKRQEFNRPNSCVKLENMSSSAFIKNYDDYENDEGKIIWLDYTMPKERGTQIGEFRNLLEKLKHGDIIKITLNANPSSLYDEHIEITELHSKRLEKLKEQLGEYFPHKTKDSEMTYNKFPNVLLQSLRITVDTVIASLKNYEFQLLTSFAYSDGQQMFTATGVLLEKERFDNFLKETKIENWELLNYSWNSPIEIHPPSISMREKLFIDKRLPEGNEQSIHSELGFFLHEKTKDAKKILESYIKYYRHYPFFSRVDI